MDEDIEGVEEADGRIGLPGGICDEFLGFGD